LLNLQLLIESLIHVMAIVIIWPIYSYMYLVFTMQNIFSGKQCISLLSLIERCFKIMFLVTFMIIHSIYGLLAIVHLHVG